MARIFARDMVGDSMFVIRCSVSSATISFGR